MRWRSLLYRSGIKVATKKCAFLIFIKGGDIQPVLGKMPNFKEFCKNQLFDFYSI